MLKVGMLIRRVRARNEFGAVKGPRAELRALLSGVATVLAVAFVGAAAGWLLG